MWLSILIVMIVLVAVLGWHLARRGTTSTPREPQTISLASVREVAPLPRDAGPSEIAAPLPASETKVVAAPAPVATDGSGAVIEKASGLELHRIDGFSLVRLGGGAPSIRPYGGRGNVGKRRIHGRVVDGRGAPVSRAIVLADASFHIERDSMMTLGGAISGSDGVFEIEDAPPGDCSVVALAGDDWTDVVRVGGDDDVELHVIGHGSLAVRMRYDGGPETFTVHVATADRGIVARYQSQPDGTLTVQSLPPGTFAVQVGLAQQLGGGVSKSARATVTIERGKTAELELAITRGTAVEVTAVPPSDSKPKGITYWLFTGDKPSDGVDATARKAATNAPSMSVGAGMTHDAVEFHDIAPGTYWACAGFFDVTTMGAFARPFGCTQVVVGEGDNVRDVSVPLS